MFKWLVSLNCPYLLDAPDDSSGGGDDLDLLEDIDPEDKEDDKDDKEDKEDSDEETEESDEEEDEDKEEEDEDKEDKEDKDEENEDDDKDEEDRITHASDLKKAYPDIFKKFPDVKAVLYREQEYSELFGSPKDAQAIVAKSNILDNIERDLIGDGNPKALLDTVKKSSPESFKKIAYSILPYLQEADKEAYLEVAALPIKQLLRNMIAKFDAKSNEHKSALYVHRYFFDNVDVNGKTKVEEGTTTTKSEKELEYEKRIQAIDKRDEDQFFESTNTSYVTKLTKEFRSTIDTDDRLSDWMKTKLVESGLADIRKQLDADPRFKRQMESLWSQSKASGYSSDLKSRIVSTALARAKSLVAKTRARLLAEALKGKAKKQDKEDKEDKTNVRQFEKPKKPSSQSSNKKPLTDMDILRGNG